MILHQFNNGDTLHRLEKALILRFGGNRTILSTAAFNGGYQTDLKYVFNHDCKENGQKNTPLKAASYDEHMQIIAVELGLQSEYACGLSTAADMDNVSVVSETYSDLTVTAIVTGGIDVNGGRVGDPAQWHESDGNCIPAQGTINIILHIDAQLPEGTLTRALVTCTEAKTAALQELLAPSLYSSGIATGSGTDGTVIIANPESPIRLTFAGKHAKLGELIGRTVMKAVKEALHLQTGLSGAQQFDVFRRIGRFGVTREKILQLNPSINPVLLDHYAKKKDLIVYTSLYVHLLDQVHWGLITQQDAVTAGQALLDLMDMNSQINTGNAAESAMLNAFSYGLANLAVSNI